MKRMSNNLLPIQSNTQSTISVLLLTRADPGVGHAPLKKRVLRGQKRPWPDYELDIPFCYMDTFWRVKAHLNSACQIQFAVLLHCPAWNAIRANYFTVTSLLDFFSTVTSRCIVDFIKEIGFYRRIWTQIFSYYFYRFYHLSNIFVHWVYLSWLILS